MYEKITICKYCTPYSLTCASSEYSPITCLGKMATTIVTTIPIKRAILITMPNILEIVSMSFLPQYCDISTHAPDDSPNMHIINKKNGWFATVTAESCTSPREPTITESIKPTA